MVHLYTQSLLASSAISLACVGNFSGTKQQEIALVRGAERIELVRVDPNTGKLESIVETHVFAQIRSVSSFKLTGGTKGPSSSHPLALPWSRLHALAVHARPAR